MASSVVIGPFELSPRTQENEISKISLTIHVIFFYGFLPSWVEMRMRNNVNIYLVIFTQVTHLSRIFKLLLLWYLIDLLTINDFILKTTSHLIRTCFKFSRSCFRLYPHSRKAFRNDISRRPPNIQTPLKVSIQGQQINQNYARY